MGGLFNIPGHFLIFAPDPSSGSREMHDFRSTYLKVKKIVMVNYDLEQEKRKKINRKEK